MRFAFGLLWLAAVVAGGLSGGCAGPGGGAGEGQAKGESSPRYDLTERATLPARLDVPVEQRGGYLLAAVTIDGGRGGRFLIDTGSGLSGIDRGLANRLNLPERAGGLVRGVGGLEAYQWRRVGRWAMAGVALPGEELAGLKLRDINRAAPFHANGIIGYNALKGVPFTIDAAGPRLSLHHPDRFTPPDQAERFRLSLHGGVPVVRAKVSGGREVWLLLDTGDESALTLPRAVLEQWDGLTSVPESGPGRSMGVGGSVSNERTWIRTLTLFGRQLRDVPVSFEGGAGETHRGRPLGRVGLELLKHFRLTFDHAERAVWVRWNPDGS